MKKRRLAIVGARGLGHHGGFETVVAELAPRLRDGGHEIYCSTRSTQPVDGEASIEGINLVRFPFRFPRSYSIGKMFEVLYDSFFVLKAKCGLKCEAVYCLGVAGGISLLLTKWSRTSSAVNVDGLEWTRDKFGPVTRLFLRLSFLACCIGSSRIVLDNRALMSYVPRRFRGKTVCITYGVSPIECREGPVPVVGPDREMLLRRGEFWLVVARLEPENNIHLVVRAYNASSSTRPLVIVGDCSSQRYKGTLEALIGETAKDKNVILAGSIYDSSTLNALRCSCLAYVHGHSVGGTNPSLLEAMSAGNLVICHDNPFNREVASDSGLFFSDESSLRNIMNEVDAAPMKYSNFGKKARELVERHHGWDDIVAEHERMFSELNDS
jgi:rhamnosyltransferase